MRDAYAVQAKAEGGSCYPWSNTSYAILVAPALVDAVVNEDAKFRFLTDAEKKQVRKQQFSLFIDDTITIGAVLVSDPEAFLGYKYVEIGGYMSCIDRIVLETDTGKHYTSISQHDVESKPGDMSSTRMSDSGSAYWTKSTFLLFPRYDNGVQIINEDTEWIRLWVIAGTDRIYFQFDFNK